MINPSQGQIQNPHPEKRRVAAPGSLALQRPLGTTRDGKPRQIGPKGGNRVYNAAYLRVQKGNVG